MECSDFMDYMQNSNPQDITQVERIMLIYHLNECSECSKLIHGHIEEHGIINSPEIKNLAEVDKAII